jgi:hypothetical protein
MNATTIERDSEGNFRVNNPVWGMHAYPRGYMVMCENHQRTLSGHRVFTFVYPSFTMFQIGRELDRITIEIGTFQCSRM